MIIVEFNERDEIDIFNHYSIIRNIEKGNKITGFLIEFSDDKNNLQRTLFDEVNYEYSSCNTDLEKYETLQEWQLVFNNYNNINDAEIDDAFISWLYNAIDFNNHINAQKVLDAIDFFKKRDFTISTSKDFVIDYMYYGLDRFMRMLPQTTRDYYDYLDPKNRYKTADPDEITKAWLQENSQLSNEEIYKALDYLFDFEHLAEDLAFDNGISVYPVWDNLNLYCEYLL